MATTQTEIDNLIVLASLIRGMGRPAIPTIIDQPAQALVVTKPPKPVINDDVVIPTAAQISNAPKPYYDPSVLRDRVEAYEDEQQRKEAERQLQEILEAQRKRQSELIIVLDQFYNEYVLNQEKFSESVAMCTPFRNVITGRPAITYESVGAKCIDWSATSTRRRLKEQGLL